MSADNTAQEQRGVPFPAGQSGNPAGRPKGARNKLGEAFLKALSADWDEHGQAAITSARAVDPVAYVKIVASLLPKELKLDGEGDGIPSGFTVTFIRPAAPPDGDDRVP